MREQPVQQKSEHWVAMSIGIGVIAGLRSMTAPAVVAWAANQGWINRSHPVALLKSKSAVSIMSVLAIGEWVVDQLPATPNRTEPAALVVRIVTGGFSAGALCASKKRSVVAGAVLGGLAAVAGAFIGYTTRRQLHERFHLSDKAIAFAEDAIAVGGGLLLVRV